MDEVESNARETLDIKNARGVHERLFSSPSIVIPAHLHREAVG
jgi:hypothetical protein